MQIVSAQYNTALAVNSSISADRRQDAARDARKAEFISQQGSQTKVALSSTHAVARSPATTPINAVLAAQASHKAYNHLADLTRLNNSDSKTRNALSKYEEVESLGKGNPANSLVGLNIYV